MPNQKYQSSIPVTQQIAAANTGGVMSGNLNSPNSDQEFNVVRDYDWTLSLGKAQLEKEIPFIRLKEYKIAASSAITSLFASIGMVSDLAKANLDVIESVTPTGVTNTINTVTNFAKNTAKSVGDLVNIDAGLEKFKERAQTAIKIIQQSNQFSVEGEKLQDMYGHLYLREPTNKKYIFPYFTDQYMSVKNDFSDSYQPTNTFVDDINKAVTEYTNNMQRLPSIISPGVYVERPRFFQFNAANLPSVSFSFSLFNTATTDVFLKNAKLINQLIVGNLPKRFSKVAVEPPLIYEVYIPGKAFYPFCFIESLNVSHVGTKRIISSDNVKQIVPDAYRITISLKALTTDASNFYEDQMNVQGRDKSALPTAMLDAAAGIPAAIGTQVGATASKLLNSVTKS